MPMPPCLREFCVQLDGLLSVGSSRHRCGCCLRFYSLLRKTVLLLTRRLTQLAHTAAGTTLLFVTGAICY